MMKTMQEYILSWKTNNRQFETHNFIQWKNTFTYITISFNLNSNRYHPSSSFFIETSTDRSAAQKRPQCASAIRFLYFSICGMARGISIPKVEIYSREIHIIYGSALTGVVLERHESRPRSGLRTFWITNEHSES